MSGNLPEECQTLILQAYMEKYVIDPQVTINMDVSKGGGIEPEKPTSHIKDLKGSSLEE